jgi:hypothetical protein
MESEPEVPLALLLWLEAAYPDRAADADVPESEKCALAGEQRVVRKLRSLFDQQQKPAEEDDTTQ